MNYKKEYSLKEIKYEIEMMMLEGKKRINFLELMTLTGFDKKDITKFYEEFISKCK